MFVFNLTFFICIESLNAGQYVANATVFSIIYLNITSYAVAKRAHQARLA
jgi:hypothetical protein